MTEHRDIADRCPDVVVFHGDFIDEGDAHEPGGEVVRSHEGPEPTDLDGHRTRYATRLSDPRLHANRAAAPWLAIWDDHGVENDDGALNLGEREGGPIRLRTAPSTGVPGMVGEHADYRQVTEIGSSDSRVATWKTFRVDSGAPAVAEA